MSRRIPRVFTSARWRNKKRLYGREALCYTLTVRNSDRCDSGVVGNARPCQGRDRGFESRLSLSLLPATCRRSLDDGLRGFFVEAVPAEEGNLGKEEPKLPEWPKLPGEEETEKRSAERDRRFRQQLPPLFGLAVLCVSARIANDIQAFWPRAVIAALDLALIYWLVTRRKEKPS